MCVSSDEQLVVLIAFYVPEQATKQSTMNVCVRVHLSKTGVLWNEGDVCVIFTQDVFKVPRDSLKVSACFSFFDESGFLSRSFVTPTRFVVLLGFPWRRFL